MNHSIYAGILNTSVFENAFPSDSFQLKARGNQYACLVSGILATLFFVVQIFTGGGMNYGLYAIVFSMPMAGFWYKFIRLGRKHELFLAIGYTAMVLLLSAVYIHELITASSIL